MPNLVPGAIWRPVDVGTSRPLRRKGRGAIGHVAVSDATSLLPGPLATRQADWHFYLPKQAQPDGRFFQYIDLDLTCWASYEGNPTMPAWESQGGLGTAADVNAEPWTDNQLEAAATIYAHLAETEGAPLQVMHDSLPTSRGLGGHHLGIDPWRVAGGETWSTHPGKLCPGDAKMAQLPVIISRAGEILHGSPTPPPPPPPHPTVFAWNLPAGNYYGNLAGPAQSHGGFYAWEKPEVRTIQQWLVYHGCTPVPASRWATTTWADGLWQAETDAAMTIWHARFYPGQPKPAQCWADDYARLCHP